MVSQLPTYRLFNMVVACEFPLPEALSVSSKEKPDAVVVAGPLPENAAAAEQTTKIWFGVISATEMWFRCPHALFFIRDGNHITVQMKPEGNEKNMRAFLLGSAFGFMMIQKGWYPVHGGSVVVNGKAMILTGDSGAGKSTITTLLTDGGNPFLADDVSVVTMQDGQPVVLPAYPQRKLCLDAALAFGYNPDELILLNEDRQKYALRNQDIWCNQPTPLGCVVELVPGETDLYSASRVTGHESFGLFFRNLYRSFIYQYMGVAPLRMKQILQIVSCVPIYRFHRPLHLDEPQQIRQALLALARQEP